MFPAPAISSSNFIFENPLHQNFSLPYPIIRYVLNIFSKSEDYLKFIKLCTHFALQFKTFIFEAQKNWDDYEKNLTVIGKNFTDPPKSLYLENSPFLTEILDNLCFLNYECLHICDINIHLKEFNLLLSNPATKELNLTNVTVKMDENDGTIATIDVIFQIIPHITHFYYCKVDELFSITKLKKMNEVFRHFKFKRFRFDIGIIFDENENYPKLFCEFLKYNADENSNFTLWFPEDTSQWYLNRLKKAMEIAMVFLENVNIEICPFYE